MGDLPDVPYGLLRPVLTVGSDKAELFTEANPAKVQVLDSKVQAVDSSETELFTAANPGKVQAVDSSETELFTAANPGKVQAVAKTMTTVNGTKASAGNNELAAAPGAGYRLVVTALVMQNESTTAVIMRLRSASTANGWRCLGQNQGDGLAMVFGAGREWELNENEALNFELSDADTCAYAVKYYTEAV